MQYSWLNGIIEGIKQSKNIDDIKSQCEAICRALEIDFYSFVIRIPSSLFSPEIITLSNYPQLWQEHYFSQEFMSLDPVIAYSQQHITPVNWSDLTNYTDFNSPKQLTVLKEANTYGLCTGVSIPLKAPTGEMSVFSLSSTSQRCVITECQINIRLQAQVIAPYLHEAIKIINYNAKEILSHDEVKITNREEECLLWACEGKTSWEISKIIGISERTVLFHLNNVSQKVGGVNRQHSVAKALLNGLIQPKF